MFEEFKKDKKILESDILLLIKDFEEKYGVEVSEIYLEHFRNINEKTPIINEVHLEVKL